MADPRYARLPPMGYFVRVTVVIVVTLGVLSAAWSVRRILILVVIAAVLAVGLEPAVQRLERIHVKRGWAVLLIFLGFMAFIALFAALVVPPLVREAKQLSNDIPHYVDRLQHSSGWVGSLQRKYHIAEKLRDITKDLPHLASQSFGTILGITASVAAFIFNMLMIGVLLIYFQLALPRLRGGTSSMVDEEYRARFTSMVDESIAKVGGYVSGNIVVSLIAGVGAFIALMIIGVPFAAALAVFVAITDLLPVIGATLGAIACVLVAAFSSWGDAIVTGIYFIVYQQVENYIIVPRVMQKAIDLSPAAAIVSTLIGGALAGFAGAMLALPVAAMVKVVLRDFIFRRRDEAGEQPTPPAPQAAQAVPEPDV
jgi:predicted PurR-regulated permease PerM